MTKEEPLDELRTEVTALVPGANVVDDLSNSGRAVVARLAVQGETFIAKRHNDVKAFACEVEALQTLPAQVRPALVAVGERVVVMEDLGAGPSLADHLLSDDPRAATDALLLWSRTLGAALKPTLRRGVRLEPLDLSSEVADLVELGKTFGVDALVGIADDARALATPFNQESDWFAFGPSDACPDNNRVMEDGSMKLFDFEGASWRHAASEAAYTRAPFCTCWCVAALPDGTTEQMEDAFIAALEPPEPEQFRGTVGAAACVYVLQMARRFSYFLDNDPPFAPAGVQAPTRGRQYVHGRLHLLAGYRDDYPALAQLAADMASAMRTKWRRCSPLPMYPAFR